MTTDITFRSDFDVELIDSMASDYRIIHAAQVSTRGADAEGGVMDEVGQARFIDFLMRNRHGSPFEHCVFTFRISAPIFVWREFMRHRMVSYNEESGRYKQLDPVFYVPSAKRNLVQVGKPGEYEFLPGDVGQLELVQDGHQDVARFSYENYERQLNAGIAREVARLSLPLTIYSTAYVTINARSLMNFLSLRVKSTGSAYPSFPMHEISEVARTMESALGQVMPITWTAFCERGRVAP